MATNYFSTLSMFLFIVFFIHASFTSNLVLSQLGARRIRQNDLEAMLHNDNETLNLASVDYGHIVTDQTPSYVFYPTSTADIAALIKSVYDGNLNYKIAARGVGHSVRGQAFAKNGIVINMTSLGGEIGQGSSSKINVVSHDTGAYVDVNGEVLWIDLLQETLSRNLTPPSWTDYLYLTVGGTLSNAGISGQSFRFGPQITNVLSLEVVNGKGEVLNCDRDENPELFFGALGGLGQFGVITRARIGYLRTAPKMVKWVRLVYGNFAAFSLDQERLLNTDIEVGPDYVEGLVMLNTTTGDSSSFFSLADQPRILALINEFGIIYVLETAKYIYDGSLDSVHQDFSNLLQGLNNLPDQAFEKNVTYLQFLNRVHQDELALRAQGLWEVPHPWLNLFIPKSRILDFDAGVFKGIILQRNLSNGVILFYPMLKNKWLSQTSAVIPDDEVFYTAALLFAAGFDNWKEFEVHVKDILDFCAGIEVKQYLPHYESLEDWQKHFGSKWSDFQARKSLFDPKNLLSPGQRIFN